MSEFLNCQRKGSQINFCWNFLKFSFHMERHLQRMQDMKHPLCLHIWTCYIMSWICGADYPWGSSGNFYPAGVQRTSLAYPLLLRCHHLRIPGLWKVEDNLLEVSFDRKTKFEKISITIYTAKNYTQNKKTFTCEKHTKNPHDTKRRKTTK